MAKIVLGKRPQKISRTISFKLVDGTDGFLVVDYKYRTRSEYGALVDELNARAKEALDAGIESAGAEKVVGYKDILSEGAGAQVEFLMEALQGWNLDSPFSREALIQLVDEYPQAGTEIINTYRLACTEGRLGN